MSEALSEARPNKIYAALLISVLLIPAALGSSTTIFNDGDVSWHIATGEWILDHRAIPHSDPFSFTWFGKAWVPIEWLAEVLYALAHRLAGYSGVAALVTAALIALHAIIFLNATRSIRPFVATAAVVAMDLILIPMMLARPHLLAWPLMALWTLLMLRAREQDRAPPIAAALLMTIWANLHGSFLIGLLIGALFGLEALVDSREKARALRQWLVFGVACGVAIFINANGMKGVVHPFQMAGLHMLPLIDEWKPSSLTRTPFFFAVLALTLALIAWKRPRIPWVRWVLLAGLLVMALWQARHQAVLAIVAAMVLPQGFGKTGDHSSRQIHGSALAVAFMGAIFLIAARALLPIVLPDNESNPWKLIAQVPPQLRSQPVLNGYSMGGPLILSGIRPYIDGRGDMYGDELVTGYSRVIHGDDVEFAAIIRRWNIRWAIFPNDSKRMIALLKRSGWRPIATDKVGTIYLRS